MPIGSTQYVALASRRRRSTLWRWPAQRRQVGYAESRPRTIVLSAGDRQVTYRARIVLTDTDVLMPRTQGCGGAAQQSFCISAISAIAPCIALTSDFLVGRLAVRRGIRVAPGDLQGRRKAQLQGRRTTARMQEVEQRRERLPR